MPVDRALSAARLGKPGDLRHSVTDRDQKHPTLLAATQANTRDLAQWHVDYAAHSQPVLGRLTVSHGRGSLRPLRKNVQPLPDDFSSFAHFISKNGSADQALGYRAIVRFTASQQDGDQAPCSTCECVNLRIAPSARAANSLLLLPPFPPAAERCALMCVASIICVSVDRPFPASFRNRFSQMPRRAQRTKRL